MSENLLRHETSPYLLQHKDNPVHWRAWGEEAFEEARRSNRPVLLSIGYAACHWCHVMAHESFENPEIAALMNDSFVCIKVDREERPDVDSIYQHALALLGQQGGWPLTMFLTPDGEPYWGGTYFPPESRWGRPGFPDVLRGMASAWRSDPEKVGKNVEAIREALAKLSRPERGGGISIETTDLIAKRLTREIDPFDGGLGGAPKFPQYGVFGLMWRAWKRTGLEPHRRAVMTTLVHMCQGGIYDHVGGGFARYSVDERWLVPHFEKMLYDNALLVELLTLVWQDTRTPLFEQRVRETVGWVLREMIAPGEGDDAAFAASLDADSEGEEGRFYVWTEAEIDALLGPDAPLFKRTYDVTAAGNCEGRNILNRLHALEPLGAAEEETLARCRATLFEARERRMRPGWDDKVLADWNGLMITALARAGAAFDEPEWVKSAERAFATVSRRLTATDGRLRHSYRLGRQMHPATLDDYASMIRAALTLYEITGDDDCLGQALAWIHQVESHYADPAGGYFLTAADTGLLIARPKTAADNPTPSGNGMLAESFARLFHLFGDDEWRRRAEVTIRAFSGEIERNFLPLATLINANELLQSGLQVVIAGERDAPGTRALLAAARSLSLPTAVIVTVPPGSALPEGHPASGKGEIDGHAAAYVCEGPVCSLPLTDPERLREDLASRFAGTPGGGPIVTGGLLP